MENNKEPSNILIMLVAIALIVSIGGFLISSNKLKEIDVTGQVSTLYGHLNATVPSAADISFVTAQVNFTNQTAGTVNDTSDDNPSPFNITNDGNTCINVTLQRDQTNWLWGSVVGSDANNNNHTQYAVNKSGANTPFHFVLSNTTWTNISQSIASIAIVNLNWTAGNDTAEIEVRVHVPSDEAGGTKGTLITFAASDSGWSC